MNKKILSLVLALVMVLGTFSNVFAETKAADKKEEKPAEKVEKIVGKDNKIQYIIDKKLVQGYEDGSYKLDKNITRAEITRLLVLANGNEELSKKLQGSMKIYSDVDASHWANGVITVGTTVPSDANGIAMLAGYPDKSFKPDQDVTYAELAKMLVVLAKKDLTPEMVKNAIWASSWMTWAQQLGILDDVTIADSNKAANRADAFTMVYNALYKMQSFKRTPANETRGIISTLNKDKLVLNQDDKKEYKLTADTVIVTGNNVRSNIVYVSNTNNFHAYLGSLVRILTNDKNEVTHVIELGNPEFLAKGQAFSNKDAVYENLKPIPAENKIWKGVADNTMQTRILRNVETLDADNQKNIKGIYASIKLNGSQTKASDIVFKDSENKDKEIISLGISGDTEIYVANPYNNIARKVTLTEALSLIGYRNYDGFKIPNVYVGYDVDKYNKKVVGFNHYSNTAKVIVFNVVTKDEGANLYRVILETNSKFDSTVENTDGKRIPFNDAFNRANFAFNTGDNTNSIVERRGDVIDVKLDHKDLKKYPVVKVVEASKPDIVVADQFGNRTVLNVRNADIFNKKQYENLKVGDFVQFKADKLVEVKTTVNDKEVVEYAVSPVGKKLLDPNTVSILSIFEPSSYIQGKFEKSGSLQDVVLCVNKDDAFGLIKNVNSDNTVDIYVLRDMLNTSYAGRVIQFKVTPELAKALKSHVGEWVLFNTYDAQGEKKARFFRENKATHPEIKGENAAEEPNKTAKYINKVEELKSLAGTKNADVSKNLEAVNKKLAEIDGIKLNDNQQAALTKEIKEVEEIRAAAAAAAAQKTLDDKLAEVKVLDFKQIDKTKLSEQDLKTEVENLVKTKISDTDYNLTVTITPTPAASGGNYTAATTFEIKVEASLKADANIKGSVDELAGAYAK